MSNKHGDDTAGAVQCLECMCWQEWGSVLAVSGWEMTQGIYYCPKLMHHRACMWVIDVPNQSNLICNGEIPVILYYPTEKKAARLYMWFVPMHLLSAPMITDMRVCHTLHVNRIIDVEKEWAKSKYSVLWQSNLSLHIRQNVRKETRLFNELLY